MRPNKRERFLDYILKKAGVPEGCVMPRWGKVIFALLCPLRYLCYNLQAIEGYQWQSRTWKIYGVKYSHVMFKFFAEDYLNTGAYFKFIKKENGVITLERISAPEQTKEMIGKTQKKGANYD